MFPRLKFELKYWGLRDTIGHAIRWPIIEWLNRYDDVCWASAVMWANTPSLHPFYEWRELRHSATGCGYCGKCDATRGGVMATKIEWAEICLAVVTLIAWIVVSFTYGIPFLLRYPMTFGIGWMAGATIGRAIESDGGEEG